MSFSAGIPSTVQSSKIFKPLSFTTTTNDLRANLPTLCTAVDLGIITAHVKATDKILFLPGSVLVTAAFIGLSKAFNWTFKVVAENSDIVQQLASRYGVSQSSFVISSNTQSLRRAVEEYKPTVIIGQEIDETAKEAWRNIPAFGRLVLTSAGSSGITDLKPLSRGASILVKNAVELFSKREDEAQQLLADTLDIYQRHQVFNERAIVRDVHEKEPQLNGVQSTAPKPIVLIINYRTADIKILESRPQVKFSATASYLLIGCLGGLGRSLTTFMRQRGAQNFVFVSRSGADKPDAALIVSELRQSGANVDVHRVDASSEHDLVKIFQTLGTSRPLKGVVHAAMVLWDGMFESMTYADFTTATKPKVDAAIAIQSAVSGCDLDFFVMTSSISAAIGNAGQPATSIALPVVLDVGVVAETEGLEDTLARKGMYGIDEQEMLRAFEVAMLPRATGRQFRRFGDAHTILGLEVGEMAKIVAADSGVEVQWFGDVRFIHLRQAIERRIALHSGASGGSGSGSFRNALQATLASGPAAALELVMAHIMKRCASTLMVPVERFEPEGVSVASYGLDSMIGAELSFVLGSSESLFLTCPSKSCWLQL